MNYRRAAIFLLILSAACKPETRQPAGAAAGAGLRATVVTLRTTIQPTEETHTHRIVIVGNRVRSTDEYDMWRIFNPQEDRVTFVDDVAKTIRTESNEALTARRRAATAESLPPHYPRPRVDATGATRTIHGVTATQLVIETGTYRRELWIGEHASIPPRLFALMHASETPSSPLIPMMRPVDDALLKTAGFPLVDRTEIVFGEQRTVIERAVVAIGQETVPADLLEIPRDYVDLTPQNGSRKK